MDEWMNGWIDEWMFFMDKFVLSLVNGEFSGFSWRIFMGEFLCKNPNLHICMYICYVL